MSASIIYLIIAGLGLLLVVFALVRSRQIGGEQRLSPLAGLAFAFVIASIMFGESRLIGYSLMGIGLLLAVVDMFNKRREV